MPKKASSWGQQEYVPSGNGDASGEYADENGSNIHVFSKFKKPEGEIKPKKTEPTFDDLDKELFDIDSDTEETKEPPSWEDEFADLQEIDEFDLIEDDLTEEIELDIKEPEKVASTVENFIKQNEDDLKEIGGEEVKKILLNKYADELDVNKVKDISNNQAIKLATALNVLDNKDNLLKSLTKDKNAFFEEINKNELINGNQVWKALPSTTQAFDESIDKKIDYLQDLVNKSEEYGVDVESPSYKNIIGKIDALKLLKDSEQLKAWKEEEKALDEATNYDFSKYQKIVDKYYNFNNVYSQKAKDDAKWFKTAASSSKKFTPYAEKVINEWQIKDPKAIQMIKDYTGSYSSINHPLRDLSYPHKSSYPEQSKAKQKSFIEHVEGITKVIDSSTYDFNCWVQRGVSQLNVGKQLINYSTSQEDLDKLVGTKFEDQGFLSCGSHKGGGFASDSVIMNIYCPKGTKMLYVKGISQYSHEDETIIQRGYTYKITKVEKTNGRIYLDCEVQLGTDVNKHNKQKLEELKEKHF